jgi:inhibitor of KinA
MQEDFPRLRRASDRSMLVEFGGGVEVDRSRELRCFMQALSGAAFVRNLHPAYTSVLVTFDPRAATLEEVESALRARLQDMKDVDPPAARVFEISVCYGGEFGPDLEDVARHTNLTTTEVIQLHAAGDYHVRFLGFSPGFPYLSGLAPQLATPRLATPRTHVPAGSVAIGGAQTGVYPLASPGGWRIIGRTPLRLFDPGRTPITLLQIGDHVRFRDITRAEFERW